jgi:hypothetical protein
MPQNFDLKIVFQSEVVETSAEPSNFVMKFFNNFKKDFEAKKRYVTCVVHVGAVRPGCVFVNLFPPSLMMGQNKLERLSLESL